MMKRVLRIISALMLTLAALTAVSCRSGSTLDQNHQAATEPSLEKSAHKTSEVKVDAAMTAGPLNTFGEDLFGTLDNSRSNLTVSPLSAYTALTMAYAGAAGTTAGQLEKVLHNSLGQSVHPALSRLQGLLTSSGKDAGHSSLLIANSLWLQKEFAVRDDFLKTCQQIYGSGLKQVDFGNPEAARSAINQWAGNATNKKISDLIQSGQLSRQTRLVLANAVYFKGNWQFPFDTAATAELPFQLSPDDRIFVPTMSREGNYNYAETGNARILELPYSPQGESSFSMMLILPAISGSAPLRLRQIDHKLTGLEKRLVQVYLPKFTIRSNASLKMPLIQLGMQDAFDDGKADFSGITGDTGQKLAISDVIQNAFVEVNERGTEAAAATAVMMTTKSAMLPSDAIEFRVDRPFIFAIRENRSGAVVFWGRVVDPR